MTTIRSFDVDLNDSHSHAEEDMSLLQDKFPDTFHIIECCTTTDIWGIDFMPCRPTETTTIQMKRRIDDCRKFWRQGAELALETWSNIEKGKRGWAVNTHPSADFYCFAWTVLPGTSVVLPARGVGVVTRRMEEEWSKHYKVGTQFTSTSYGGFHSQCLFVPAGIVTDLVTQYQIEEDDYREWSLS